MGAARHAGAASDPRRRQDPTTPSSTLRGSGTIDFDLFETRAERVFAYVQRHTDVNLCVSARAAEVCITLRVENMTWREALEHLARAGGFYMEERSANLITIDHVRATYEYDDADLRTAIVEIARSAGANVVVGPNVEGRVTASIHDVPWRVALTRIVEEAGFAIAQRRHGILLVAAPKNVRAEASVPTQFRERAKWDAVREAATRAGVVTFDVRGMPLHRVVEQIQRHTDVNLEFTEQARDAPVTLRLRGIPWAEALEVVAERAGCTIRVPDSRLVILDRPPRVDAEFDNAELLTVILRISGRHGRPFVVDDGVTGRVTASMHDIPWRLALETITEAHGFHVFETLHGVLRVARSARWDRWASERRLPTVSAPSLTLHVIERPLRRVTDWIAERIGVEIVVGEDAADIRVSMDVHDLAWPHVLRLALERAKCGVSAITPGRIDIDRPSNVTIDLGRQRDARKIIRAIGLRANETIRIAPGVEGRLMMKMQSVSWRQVLESVASALELVVLYQSDGSVDVAPGGARISTRR